MDRAEQLGRERIPVLLLRFSIPAIVGMLVQALYNVVIESSGPRCRRARHSRADRGLPNYACDHGFFYADRT